MPEWLTALICLAIVITAILITSIVKFIMKRVAKSKGKELDCSKYEYLFAAISLLLSAAGVFCFLKFVAGVTDINTLVKTTALYAGSVQSVYIFVVQLIRKGWSGIWSGIKKIFSLVKSSKNPVEELPSVIQDEAKKTDENASEQTTNTDVEKLKSEFDKIINNSGKK